MCIYKVLIPFDGIITVTYNHRYKNIIITTIKSTQQQKKPISNDPIHVYTQGKKNYELVKYIISIPF